MPSRPLPPPESGGGGRPPAGPSKHATIPTEWRIELPEGGTSQDGEFGGCGRLEAGYERGPKLGEGNYGEVFLATELSSGEQVAVKRVKGWDQQEGGFPMSAIQEIKALSRLAAAKEELADGTPLRNNVVGLREVVRSGAHAAGHSVGSVYLVFDLMDHDLAGLVDSSRRAGSPLTPAQAKCYLKQLFCGLALLDRHDTLHRDLKPSNLLVNNRGQLKIADFGLALRVDREAKGEVTAWTTQVVTRPYRAPELCMGARRYGPEVDVWSAGCIMFELLTGKALFPGESDADQLDRILKVVGWPTEVSMPGCSKYPGWKAACNVGFLRWPAWSELRKHCEARGVTDPLALDLLEKLLALDPAARIKAADAALHEYFFQHPLPCKPAEMPQHEAGHETATRRRERPPRPPRPPPKLAKIKVKFKAPQSPEAAAEASDDECEAWLNKMAAGDDTEDDGSEGDGAVARRRSRKRRSRLKLSTKAKSSRAA